MTDDFHVYFCSFTPHMACLCMCGPWCISLCLHPSQRTAVLKWVCKNSCIPHPSICLRCIVFLCHIIGITAMSGRGLFPTSFGFISIAWYLVTFLLACLGSSCFALCPSPVSSGLGGLCPYLAWGPQVFTVLQADQTLFLLVHGEWRWIWKHLYSS